MSVQELYFQAKRVEIERGIAALHRELAGLRAAKATQLLDQRTTHRVTRFAGLAALVRSLIHARPRRLRA